MVCIAKFLWVALSNEYQFLVGFEVCL